MRSRERRRWLGRISLRFRLTVWVIAVVVLIQSALATVAFLYQRQSARRSLDQFLVMRARVLAREIELPAEPSRLRRRAIAESRNTLFDQFSMAVFDAAARPITESEPAPPVAAALAQRARETGGPVLEWWRPAEGPARRLVAIPFDWPGDRGLAPALVAWTSETSVSSHIAAIGRALLLAAPFAAAGAAVAGWFIAGVAVGPIEEVRDIVRRLTPESVGRRIRLGSASAEVSQLQNNLNDALARLDQGYKAQARFISNVSHEFKTPISTLLAESQTLMRREELGPEAQRFAHSVEEEMRRLGRLIESFLLLTRVREGEPPPMLHVLANELVIESISHCAPFAEAQGVRLRPTLLEDDEGLELCVLGEADLLRTMVDNLVRNAIRFSPAGGAVDVRVVRGGPPQAKEGAEQPGGEWVTIAVRDRGPGISQAMMGRLFERFSQAPEERATGRGTGLGLEIAKGVAELHGGDISVGNCPDAGAQFEIHLPVADGGVGAEAREAPTPDPAPGVAPGLGPRPVSRPQRGPEVADPAPAG